MAFSKQQLQKFANLIKIEMTDDELAAMNLDVVYDWMRKLQTVDTTNTRPMLSPATHDTPMRGDIITDGNMRDAILQNAPDNAGTSRGYFAVPKVMED